MTTLRTIKCDFPKCGKDSTEEKYNDGWPGWGRIQGKENTETGLTDFDLCPDHLNKVFQSMTGGD